MADSRTTLVREAIKQKVEYLDLLRDVQETRSLSNKVRAVRAEVEDLKRRGS